MLWFCGSMIKSLIHTTYMCMLLLSFFLYLKSIPIHVIVHASDLYCACTSVRVLYCFLQEEVVKLERELDEERVSANVWSLLFWCI